MRSADELFAPMQVQATRSLVLVLLHDLNLFGVNDLDPRVTVSLMI